MNDTSIRKITGIMISYNLSPKGGYEGCLLSVAGGERIIQLNFPPEVAHLIVPMAAPGSQVNVTASAHEKHDRHPSAVHEVLQLQSLTNDASQRVETRGPDCSEPTHISGEVSRINFAKHGEPNGAVLASGDFVHLKPHGAKAVDLTVGQHLDVRGRGWKMLDGRRIVEAEHVNGVSLQKHKEEKHGHHDKKQPKEKVRN